MYSARNLQRHCLKFASSLLQSNLSKNAISLGLTSNHLSSNVIPTYNEVTSYYCVKSLNPFIVSSRTMSTSKGRSMRSKVERRMQKESGKTLREIRRAKKLKKKLMTEEERLIYNLKRAKKKVALLLQKLKKYELPELPPSRHDPELLTPEQLQAFKKIGFRNKNYVPVGVRGVFGGVVQNMHLHWKFHETVQVCCDNFPKEKIKEMATMLARLSGGIVINIHNVKTIIMFRGRNYRQPKNLIPLNTLTKRKALFKARFEQALESQKLNIKKIEQQLRRMGVNPEDPAAMASIQRVASTFFNAIDKKEGSPYVFHEVSVKEPDEGLEQSEPSVDSDQEELDRFIADIEDAADKEYEAEEAKEQEELGRIRYWNREEFSGRFRRPDVSRNDNYDGEVRGSRFRQTAHAKHRASDSDDENNMLSDDDEEQDARNIVYSSDFDGHSDDSSESKGRFKLSKVDGEKRNNFGKARFNGSSSRHAGSKFSRNSTIIDSESESMFGDLGNAIWKSDEEENESSTKFSDNYKSNGNDKYARHIKRDERDHGWDADDSYQDHAGFDVPKGVRGKQGRVARTDKTLQFKSLESQTEDILSDLENRMWQSDSEAEEWNEVKNDINHKRNPKDADEAWDSD